MDYFVRNIDADLLSWQASTDRKPLLIRGARQVGKTESVRHLGRKFRNLVEVNFLEQSRLASIFTAGDLSPDRICRELSALLNQPIVDGQTLLFFDEIQACSAAIESLTFFKEKRPHLHVVAAGSLLEFALGDLGSFGVGRVQSLMMRPVTLYEFLRASGRGRLLDEIVQASDRQPLPVALHFEALAAMRDYMLIGGLPEIVRAFISRSDFVDIGTRLETLRLGFENDFAKYRGRVPAERLRDIMRAVAQQAGKKFVFKHAYVDAVSAQVHQALHLLELAGLVIRVQRSSANGIPLGAESDQRHFKAMLFDIGLYQRILGLSPRELIGGDIATLIHRGALSELFVGLELLGNTSPFERGELWYWHREAKSSSAEVDFVIQHGPEIFPIEVKSATKGSMKSLRKFMAEKKSRWGIRISAENFGSVDGVLIVPLYAVAELNRLIEEAS